MVSLADFISFFCGVPGVAGVLTVAGDLAVAGVLVVAGVLAVANISADPGVPILAGVFTDFTVQCTGCGR
jgi:hypothetical protein